MTDQNVPRPAPTGEPIMRAASLLTVGDRIAAGFLPPEREVAEVGFVHRFTNPNAEPWVFVAYVLPGGEPASSYFLADALIPLVAEHYEKRGWTGGTPGTSGVECACGMGYDGFNSLGEASKFLAGHIAASVPPAGVIVVADGHVVHECCGKLDDGPHYNFCANYAPCYVPSGFHAPEVIVEMQAQCAASHPGRKCSVPTIADPIGVVEGGTAAEQYDNASARYERDA